MIIDTVDIWHFSWGTYFRLFVLGLWGFGALGLWEIFEDKNSIIPPWKWKKVKNKKLFIFISGSPEWNDVSIQDTS